MPLTSGRLRAENKLMAGIMETLPTDEAQALAAGAVVRTDADTSSVAEIVHRNGAVTRLDSGSELVVDRVETDGRPRVVVTLGPGRSWHHTGPLDDPSMYEARCPAAILTARAAVFSVSCRPDGSVDVAAVRGNVVVRGLASGSVALGEGQSVTVSGTGVLGEASGFDVDDWMRVNHLLDQPESDAEPEAEGQAEAEDRAEDAVATNPLPLPRWVGRALAAVAVVAFSGLLAVTFTSADHGAPTTPTADREDPVAVRSITGPVSPLPAGAAAMIRAAQDRRVAPEPKPVPEKPAPRKFTPKAPTFIPVPAVELPAPAPPPATATATPTSCARRNGVIVFSGRVKNTSQVASRFAVDTVFKTSGGQVFASKTATTTAALAPGESRSWSVSVSSSSAASACDIAGVRPV